MPPQTRYRCPSCGSIDWYRDGCIISEVDSAVTLRCSRVQGRDPSLAGTTWSCNQCAHELPPDSRVALDLDGLQQATCNQA